MDGGRKADTELGKIAQRRMVGWRKICESPSPALACSLPGRILSAEDPAPGVLPGGDQACQRWQEMRPDP